MSVLLVLALTSIAHNPTHLPDPVSVTLEGEVREIGGGVGGSPRAQLKLDDQSTLVLHGRTPPDSDELRRLAGIRVRIVGVKGDPTLPRSDVRVAQYEILDVGGKVVPRIGSLALAKLDEGPRLLFVDEQGQAEVLPETWLKKMEPHVGAKLWVIGSSSRPGRLTPSRFGILRPGPNSPTESKETKEPNKE